MSTQKDGWKTAPSASEKGIHGTKPMTKARRLGEYVFANNGGALTGPQRRRVKHKQNRAERKAREDKS